MTPTATVKLCQLLPADSPRLAGENLAHVHALAESEASLPPILVHRASMRIIDGMHRVRVARLRGEDTIEVRFFDGCEEAAFVRAVSENVGHGLPLSLDDRRAAAKRIMLSHPEWSDRAVATATGLGARTVAAIRRSSTEYGSQLNKRKGRDGRVRPLNWHEGRQRASNVIVARPDASLREIAREAGISVGTARDVRERIRNGADPIPAKQRKKTIANQEKHTRPSQEPPSADWRQTLRNLAADPSLRFNDSGRRLLRWLEARAGHVEEFHKLTHSIPEHCKTVIARMAKDWGTEWLELARELER